MCGDHWGRGGSDGHLSLVMPFVGVGLNSLGQPIQAGPLGPCMPCTLRSVNHSPTPTSSPAHPRTPDSHAPQKIYGI